MQNIKIDNTYKNNIIHVRVKTNINNCVCRCSCSCYNFTETDNSTDGERTLPVAFLHQRLPLFFAGVLLPFISLIQYFLRCRTPFETVSSHPLRTRLPLISDWSSRTSRSARTVSGMIEFWEKKQDLILTA